MTQLRDENGRPVGTVLTAVAASALAGVAVLALVGVLILAFGHRAGSRGPEQTVADAGTGAAALTPNGTADATPGTSDADAPDASTSPGASQAPAQKTAGSRASQSRAPEGSDGTASESGAGPATVPPSVLAETKVVVLNATDRDGLAARFQRTLEAKGWNVVATGNFRGNIPATTVYYPDGQQAAAAALDGQFTEVNRVRPVFSGLSETRLTVILTDDFPA